MENDFYDDNIYNLFSSSDLLNWFIDSVLVREVEQKFLYQWRLARNFYEESPVLAISVETPEEIELNKFYYNFWINNCFEKWEKTALISLWCWNSKMELNILEKLNKDFSLDYDIDYFAVDSSEGMLKLSIENSKNMNWLKKEFICADFSTSEFRHEINRMTKWYKKRIFTFFWNTIWNISHTKIIDVLLSLLNDWEKIWLWVALRNWTTPEDNLKLTMKYKKFLESELKFFFEILWDFWVPKENWEIKLSSEIEKSINAQKFHFYFEFNKKTEIEIKWEKIIFLEWEKLYVLKIYEYEEVWLANFFKEHYFNLISSTSKKWIFSRIWQFLFEKSYEN